MWRVTAALLLTLPGLGAARADEVRLGGLLPGVPETALAQRVGLTMAQPPAATSPGDTVRPAVLAWPPARADSGAPVALLTLSLGVAAPDGDRGYARLSYRTSTWYGSTFWTGPDWTRVGRDWHHPGERTPSIRCFQIPRDGSVSLRGRVRKLHLDGDGVRVSIRHNQRTIWQQDLAGKDDVGVDPQLTLAVKAGDRLRFVVDKLGGISCDTTGWDPQVVYADGTVCQASRSFGDRQGTGGWYYEMDGQAAPAPVLYTLDGGLLRRAQTPGIGETLTGDERRALPLLIFFEPETDTGLAVALDAAGPWQATSAYGDDGRLHCRLAAAPTADGALPRVHLAAVEGSWIDGLRLLRPGGVPALAEGAAAARRQVLQGLSHQPEAELLAMVQDEWLREDRLGDDLAAYAAAAARHRAALAALAAELGQTVPEVAASGDARCDWQRVRLLKRQVALSNPLLGRSPLLFCQRVPPRYNHLVMQYFGWRQRAGGSLAVLPRPGVSLARQDLLDAQLPAGSYLEPRLSYDGGRVLLAFVAARPEGLEPGLLPVNEAGGEDGYYHLYVVNTDGTGLRQLTSGPYDDMMGTWLPDGDVVFCSTRRQGYSRCFGPQFSRRWHSYTLHRLNPDTGAIQRLSVNDVSEWFPEVGADGRLLFARWDYIDRDAVTHQNLWSMNPDGTNQMAVWGNATPKPHCMFQAKAVPHSRRIAFTASAHHAVTGGPICLLDPAVDSASDLKAVTRVTPLPFPEAEGRLAEYYESPWPLSERYFLTAYSPWPLPFEGEANPRHHLGLYLLDAAGNRELLYRAPRVGCTNPTPLRARPAPPVVATTLPVQRPALGRITIADVYEGLGEVPRGTIREVRVVQILPKTTFVANSPAIGLAGEENARVILGTAPVDADGSAHFEGPAGKPLLFQLLDAQGQAYQTMRSTTSLQPGERLSCAGCHEPRMAAPTVRRTAAARRTASTLRTDALAGEPFSFPRQVQPVLDRACISCHAGDRPAGGLDLSGRPKDGFSAAYWALCGPAEAFHGGGTNPGQAATALVPRFGQRNQVQVTPPGGLYGARGSRLLKLLRAGHHDVRLTLDDYRRLAAWIDLNAVCYGVYDAADQARQLRGEAVPVPVIQ